MADEYQEVEIDKLKLGYVLQFPVLQRDQLLLLSVGTVISPRVVQFLHMRGIDKVKIHAKEAAAALGDHEKEDAYAKPIESADRFYKRLATPSNVVQNLRQQTLFKSAISLRLDNEIREQGTLARFPRAGNVHVRGRPLGDIRELHDALREREAREDELAERVKELQFDTVHRARVDSGPLLALVEAALAQFGYDPDLFCLVIRAPSANPYPGRHAHLVARLSMAIGAYLGWSRAELLAVGLGALLHDTGMLRVSDRLYRTRNRIDSLQRQDLIKHPIYCLDLVGLDNDLDEYVRYIVYQTHERCNGTGYPRGWTTPSIHPAARLVGLVDAYIAMISHRPHRNPLLPHQAILEIMQETRGGLWEPAMTRGLLRAVSLYPLGSFVELSDGRIGRAVQTNPRSERQPRLEVWTDPAAIAHEPGEPLDLGTDSRVTVSRAVVPPQNLGVT